MNDNLKVVFGFALNYMYKVSPESFTERSDVNKIALECLGAIDSISEDVSEVIDLMVKEYNRLNNNESN